ncbi:hypoxanthine-guanine phosphoribosyltransferase [Marinimicrobium sp. ABcell2]|uniref:hypoxanthine-guanine phosphoribosyltransferase n=1 Tax=Marinimicrobium sp. ABcell2 TaxID=3069751 RepID=UPI0027AE1B79|nr:hypoxanthine-guanine phosphoribosyltransferase [Marinimicrobium sp. ABcell2]MDQ2075584.1 hypoxanthine-guanine phosphoribosyltransferase [Marinimicrobium sp. ABcell2]
MDSAQWMMPLLAKGVRCLFSEAEVHEALQRMAGKINASFSATEPVLVLGVMNGALVTLGQLLPQLQFPLQLDYVHATRYNQGEAGGSLEWRRHPQEALDGRQVLIVDDILDRGITLAAIVDYCQRAGAAEVKTAVLARKTLPSAPVVEADFVALRVPDEYVFGFGMDYRGLWRNLSGIYALPPGG